MILNGSCRAQPSANELRRAKNRRIGIHMKGRDTYVNLNLCCASTIVIYPVSLSHLQ